jgi:hypothetical protein
MSEKTYKADADRLFPEGCKCGNNGGGDCDWCEIFYNELGEDYDPDEEAREWQPGGQCNNSLTIHKG